MHALEVALAAFGRGDVEDATGLVEGQAGRGKGIGAGGGVGGGVFLL